MSFFNKRTGRKKKKEKKKEEKKSVFSFSFGKKRNKISLFQFLLGAELVAVTAFALTAVVCSGGESGVALSADHLVAVVLTSKSHERGVDHTTTETENEVEGALLLDVVVGKGAAVLELLAGKDESLLIRGDALLVLDLGLDVVDGIARLDLKGDGLACESLHEDLHFF